MTESTKLMQILTENGIRQAALTVGYNRKWELCAPPSLRKYELKLTYSYNTTKEKH